LSAFAQKPVMAADPWLLITRTFILRLLYVVLLMEGLLQFFFFYGDGIKKNAEW
jgi:hypothetical protein